MTKTSAKTKILYLDDENENLLGFEVGVGFEFDILTANNAAKALELLDSYTVSVLMVDYKMPDVDGISFVVKVKEKYPDIVCILVTAYADLNTAVDALNHNVFYHFIQKPWNHLELKKIIANAIDKYNLEIEREELLASLNLALEKERDASRLKDVFLSNISHEIRTPINGILGFANIAIGYVKEPQIKQYLDIIRVSGEQLMYTIQGIIDSSMILNNQLEYNEEEFNLHSEVENLLADMNEKYAIKLEDIKATNKIPADLIMVSDKDKLLDALKNIIDNAFKFSDKGEICISKGNSEQGRDCSILVNNTMGGLIPEDKFELIFKPFRQVDERLDRVHGGNGLGLFIARSYVEFLGGEIRVESNVEHGTTFSIALTCKREEAKGEKKPSAKANGS